MVETRRKKSMDSSEEPPPDTTGVGQEVVPDAVPDVVDPSPAPAPQGSEDAPEAPQDAGGDADAGPKAPASADNADETVGIYVGFRRDARAPTSAALSSLFSTKAGFTIDRIDMKPACAFIYVKKEMKTDDGMTYDIEVSC